MASIAFHIGAGTISSESKQIYKTWMHKACKVGHGLLLDGCSATDIAVAILTVMENCPLTNAGIGSSLTKKGTVECDAAVMEGSNLQFGAVGAVSGVPNPVILAHRLLQEQSHMRIGNLVSPSLLVGEGAREWARKKGIPTCDPSMLITEKSMRTYKDVFNHMRKLKRQEKRRALKIKTELGSPTSAAESCDVASTDKCAGAQQLSLGLDGAMKAQVPAAGCADVARAVHAGKRASTKVVYRGSCPASAEIGRPAKRRRADEGSVSHSRDGNEEDVIVGRGNEHGRAILGRKEHATTAVAQRRIEQTTREVQKQLQSRLDTVGCVVVDQAGNVASGVSSGGIIFKESGRLGQSAVYGAGCWAENNCDDSGANVASCTTGLGEMLVSTQLASNSARRMAHRLDPMQPGLHKDIRALFLDNKFLSSYTHHPRRSGGCLLLRHNPLNASTDLYAFHTTSCFGYAFMGADSKKPTIKFTSLPPHQQGLEVMLEFHSYCSPTPSMAPLPLASTNGQQPEELGCIQRGLSGATVLANGVKIDMGLGGNCCGASCDFATNKQGTVRAAIDQTLSDR